MAMSRANGRLSPEQLGKAQERAISFQKRLVEKARGRVGGGRAESGVFFAALFQMAGEAIEGDVDGFCDLAERVFEEIEAHGQEPMLDGDWLGEVVGDRDTFSFSTESLVSDLVTTHRKKRRRQKQLSQEEQDRLREEVENAILDEKDDGGEVQDYEQAIAVAHGENVKQWIEKIRLVLMNSEDGVLDFWTIRERTGLRPTELFLGLLLGQKHWRITQQEFYGNVTVRIRGQGSRREERRKRRGQK